MNDDWRRILAVKDCPGAHNSLSIGSADYHNGRGRGRQKRMLFHQPKDCNKKSGTEIKKEKTVIFVSSPILPSSHRQLSEQPI